MTFEVIHNPAFVQPAGFTQDQFRKLDRLYCKAASDKLLSQRTVDCDFDKGVATYTYYLSSAPFPYLQFVIRKVGPRGTMFELYKQGKGRIIKSGVFDRTYDKLCIEIEALSDPVEKS